MTHPTGLLSRLPFALGLLGAAAVLAGCARKTPDPVKTEPAVVTVTTPISRMVTDYEEFTGRMEPYKVVELKSRVTGHLEQVAFEDGHDVSEGKLLFAIDPRLYKADFDRTDAALSKARKHNSTMKLNYDRVKLSYDKGIAGKEALDLAEGEVEESEADIKSAVAAREQADTNLRFTKIYAPFDGRMSKRLVDPGNLVKADETSLTTIVALDPIYAAFDVDERTVMWFRNLINKGEIKSSREEARFVEIGTANDEDHYPLTGQLVFTDNQIDPNTGTLRVRAILRNPRLTRAPWYLLSPGQFIRVRMPVGNPRPGLLIPEKAIGTDQGQKFVFVVKDVRNERGEYDHEVERRSVRLGPQYGTYRVIEDHVLKPGDRVIVDGLLRVRPGSKVNPKPAEPDKLAEPSVHALESAPMPRSQSSEISGQSPE